MTKPTFVAGAALLLLGTSVLVAEQRVTRVNPPVGGVQFAEPFKPASAGGNTRVVGTVIDIRQIPVAYAKVHLRDLTTGEVVTEVATNDRGEYEFDVLDPGTYVVEMIMIDGYVVGLSNAGSLARYETLNTVVMLPGRWDAGAQRMVMTPQSGSYFGISAQSTMTATTIELAAEQDVRPMEPGEPVSSNKIS